MTVNVGGQTRGRGAEAVAAEEKKEEQSKINPSDYSCEVILEKTTKEKANDRNFLQMPLRFIMLLMEKNV